MTDKNKISSFLQGELSDSDKIEFHEWLNASSENKNDYFQEKDIWDACQSQSKKVDLKKEWAFLSRRIDALKDRGIISINNKLRFWSGVAALILITFGLGWSSQIISNSLTKKDQYSHQLEVPRGQRSKLLLADGSEVWLNSDSKMSFSVNENSQERIVNLEGEASFHVAHNKKQAFIVKVKGQDIRVLGTTFNVRSYSNEESVYTTLEEGSIELKAAGKTIIMKPKQQIEYNRISKNISVKKVHPELYSAWRNGRYVFENEELTHIIKMAERWYDVDFIYPEGAFKDMHFSGVIKRNKSIEHVLTLINHTTPIRYEMKRDMIMVSPVE